MSEWKARRFWKEATVERQGEAWTVRLDGRPVKTPGKNDLALPTRALAEAVAAEWQAQEEVIDPRRMPFTRAANSAIEKVAPQRAEVAQMLAGYGDSDLTCYRAAGPEELVARQAAAWDPLLDWAEAEFGARLIPVEGVMHQPQPPQALARLAAPLEEMTVFELTGFHDLVTVPGSLVIGLAAARRAFAPEALWQAARVDEQWQQEQWGEDDEAAAAAAAKQADFLQAQQFFHMASTSGR
jgi:chaperone required for assembly of F1-ATPase